MSRKWDELTHSLHKVTDNYYKIDGNKSSIYQKAFDKVLRCTRKADEVVWNEKGKQENGKM
jgi:hypothetical protein